MWSITGYDLSILAAKTAVILVVLLALYRLLGKRDLAQFNVYDLVTIMALANSVQNAMTGGRGQVLVGIVCSAILLGIAFLVGRVFVKAPRLERLMLGAPTLLVIHGQVLEAGMRRERITREDLMVALRQHGIADAKHVEMAVLELDGTISVVPAGKGQSHHIDSP